MEYLGGQLLSKSTVTGSRGYLLKENRRVKQGFKGVKGMSDLVQTIIPATDFASRLLPLERQDR